MERKGWRGTFLELAGTEYAGFFLSTEGRHHGSLGLGCLEKTSPKAARQG